MALLVAGGLDEMTCEGPFQSKAFCDSMNPPRELQRLGRELSLQPKARAAPALAVTAVTVFEAVSSCSFVEVGFDPSP